MHVKPIICTLASALAAAIAAPTAAAHDFATGTDPEWSPDGKELVYVRGLDDAADLWLMDANGRHKRPLLRTPDVESDPSWSPDGTRIAYSARRGNERHVFVIQVTTRTVTQVTHSALYDYEPDWSPDGSRLVFSRYDSDEDRSQLFLSNADGSQERQVVVDDGDDVGPRWSPDGRFVAFVGGPDDEGYIELVEVATYAHTRLTHGGEEYSAAWTADGRILYANDAGEDETSG